MPTLFSLSISRNFEELLCKIATRSGSSPRVPAIKLLSLSKILSLLNSALWCPGLDSAHHTSTPLAGYLWSSALGEHRRKSVRLEEEGGMSYFTFVSHWLPFFLLLQGLPQNASSPWQKPWLSLAVFPTPMELALSPLFLHLPPRYPHQLSSTLPSSRVWESTAQDSPPNF